MLDLNRETDERGAWHDPWKILVYDEFCRDVISPLLKKGDLRKRGITLHLLIDSVRDQIADVPAIYFVQPTKANVDRLGSDCAAGLYEAYYLNFTPAVPRVRARPSSAGGPAGAASASGSLTGSAPHQIP